MAWPNLNYALGIGLGLVAALTATFGNLAAYSQKNVKRLLAYSTIAHAGYMLMAVAAMMVILNGPHVPNVEVSLNVSRAIEGLLYYLCVYMFMNLGAFAVVALVRNEIFSEEIEDYAGLAQQAPRYCLCLAVCLVSLVGIPPFGGFFAKWVVFSSLLQAGYVSRIMWVVLVIGGVNTVFSLFYYLRVLKAMYLTPRPEGARRTEDALPAGALCPHHCASRAFNGNRGDSGLAAGRHRGRGDLLTSRPKWRPSPGCSTGCDTAMQQNDVLNQVLVVMGRSLLQYSAESLAVDRQRLERRCASAIEALIAEQGMSASGRLAELLDSRGWTIEFGVFPGFHRTCTICRSTLYCLT